MDIKESIKQFKESALHNEAYGDDLRFSFLEQTKEIVPDRHLKSLFETGDKPSGVDFELLINSKAHKDDLENLRVEIKEQVQTDLDINNYNLNLHKEESKVHLEGDEKEYVSKIPSIENSVNSIFSILGATARQYIVATIEEMYALTDLIHADICHVIGASSTYIYDIKDTDENGTMQEWIKVSDFESVVSVDWSIITNKPVTFNPNLHNHEIEDIIGLKEALETAIGGDLSEFIRKNTDIVLGDLGSTEEKSIIINKKYGEVQGTSKISAGNLSVPSFAFELYHNETKVSSIELTKDALLPIGSINLGESDNRFKGAYFSGHINNTSGSNYYAGDEGSTAWSGFYSKRFVGEKQYQTYFGAGASGSNGFVALGIENLTDKTSFRYLMNENSFYPDNNLQVDLGVSGAKWKDIYANRSIVPTYLMLTDTNKHTMINNNGSRLCFSRVSNTGSWIDDFMYMEYSNKKVNVPNDFECGTLRVGGKKITINSTAPSSPAVGDVWITV